MSSLPGSGTAPLDEARNDASASIPSLPLENGRIRLEEDKPKDGKKKKRNNRPKKKGTGFEGQFSCPATELWPQYSLKTIFYY